MITKEEMAVRLHGREYGEEILDGEEAEAADAQLLIVLGASDDLVEFYGAWRDEAGGPGEVLFDAIGVLPDRDDDWDDAEMLAYLTRKKTAFSLDSEFERDGWEFAFSPAAKFQIFEEGEVYGEGLVIDLKELAR